MPVPSVQPKSSTLVSKYTLRIRKFIEMTKMKIIVVPISAKHGFTSHCLGEYVLMKSVNCNISYPKSTMRNNKQATMTIMKGTKPKQLMVKSRASQSDHMQNITRMKSARKLYMPQLCWSFDKAGNKEGSHKECCSCFFMYKELNMGSIQFS